MDEDKGEDEGNYEDDDDYDNGDDDDGQPLQACEHDHVVDLVIVHFTPVV